MKRYARLWPQEIVYAQSGLIVTGTKPTRREGAPFQSGNQHANLLLRSLLDPLGGRIGNKPWGSTGRQIPRASP